MQQTLSFDVIKKEENRKLCSKTIERKLFTWYLTIVNETTDGIAILLLPKQDHLSADVGNLNV